MDRTQLIGIILISALVGVWIFFQSGTKVQDVTPAATKSKQASKVLVPTPSQAQIFADSISEQFVVVETDLLRVRLSSKGATVVNWRLKHYQPWYKDQQPQALVDLIQPGAHEFALSFRSASGANVEGTSIPFTFENAASYVKISGDETVTISAVAMAPGGGTIRRHYKFYGNRYHSDTRFDVVGLDSLIPATNRYINVHWSNGIRYNEKSSVDESGNAVVIAAHGKTIEEYELQNFNQREEQLATGNIQFLATRSKYFAVAMRPATGFDGTAYYGGIKYGADNEGTVERYAMRYRLPIKNGSSSHSMQLFAGPMIYDTLKQYGLTEIMNFGWKFIVKPIGEYFMLPLLKLIHSGISNWGIAIILFGIVMKLLLYPLSIGQVQSARKMQLLAPLMNQIREKHKDDQMKQQQETMKLYSEYGINPAGGCLPLLLQMPFLYALYSVLNLNVELRQAAFLPMWLTDLSIPDVILELPFKLPLLGIDKFSGLALLMGATLFVQQRQTITDPRQQAMVYMMPVMFTLMFSSLPSGLNLYYFVFNVLGIAQQEYMKRFSKNQLTLADLKKQPKKEGWLQKKMREAQEIAASQGRTLPGQPKSSQNTAKPSQNKTGKRK
jgi:YidC/Oxa1 family membrane protein insertase